MPLHWALCCVEYIPTPRSHCVGLNRVNSAAAKWSVTMFEMQLLTAKKSIPVPPKGQAMFLSTVGEQSWTVPKNVTSISIIAIGGGGGYKGWKGGDARSAYMLNVAVTPGEILKVAVGAGGASWSEMGDGSSSYVLQKGNILVYSYGGANGRSSNITQGQAITMLPGGRLYGIGGGSPNSAGSLTGYQGAVRIIWGEGRPTPPNAAPDV